MGAYVKGAGVPKGCLHCPFNNSSIYCSITKSYIDRDYENSERLKDCPLIQITVPHGRLIDVDAFLEMLHSYAITENNLNFYDRVKFALQKAPTILEDEDG